MASIEGRQARRVVWGLGALALVALVAVSYRANEPGDFLPVWQATHRFLGGESPYVVPLFVYPPSALLLLAPFGAFGLRPAFAVFLVIDAALIVLAVVLSVRALGLRRRPWLLPGLVLALPLAAPVVTTIHLGNVNGLIFAGEAVALLALAHGRPNWAGWALGATLAIKPVLAPLLLLVVLGRRWGMLVRAVAVPCVLSALAFPFLRDGSAFFSDTLPFLLKGNSAGLQEFNVSLGASLEPLGVPAGLILAVRVLVAAGVAALLVKVARADDSLRRTVELGGLVLLGTFLVFSFSWSYYTLFLTPWLLLIAAGWSIVPRVALVPALVLLLSPDVFAWRHANPTASHLASMRITLGMVVLLAAAALGSRTLVQSHRYHGAAGRPEVTV
jgi:arabinofuranan 3-O-arabinosyltransferase